MSNKIIYLDINYKPIFKHEFIWYVEDIKSIEKNPFLSGITVSTSIEIKTTENIVNELIRTYIALMRHSYIKAIKAIIIHLYPDVVSIFDNILGFHIEPIKGDEYKITFEYGIGNYIHKFPCEIIEKFIFNKNKLAKNINYKTRKRRIIKCSEQ